MNLTNSITVTVGRGRAVINKVCCGCLVVRAIEGSNRARGWKRKLNNYSPTGNPAGLLIGFPKSGGRNTLIRCAWVNKVWNVAVDTIAPFRNLLACIHRLIARLIKLTI